MPGLMRIITLPPGLTLPYWSSCDRESTLTMRPLSAAFFISSAETLLQTYRRRSGREPGQLVDMQFAGRHGVGVAAFFTDDAQEGEVRVGFGGVVDMESRKAGKAEQFPATPAQHVFIVDVERGAVLGGEFLRRRVSKKADLVGLGGANV